MELCKDEMRRGYIWFFGAGLFAVAVSVLLFTLDNKITDYHNHNHEYEAEYMGELRKAQTTLGSSNVDDRTVKK